MNEMANEWSAVLAAWLVRTLRTTPHAQRVLMENLGDVGIEAAIQAHQIAPLRLTSGRMNPIDVAFWSKIVNHPGWYFTTGATIRPQAKAKGVFLRRCLTNPNHVEVEDGGLIPNGKPGRLRVASFLETETGVLVQHRGPSLINLHLDRNLNEPFPWVQLEEVSHG
mgnify:CR=1 FL=1